MAEWIALSRKAHAEQGYRPRQGYQHAAQQMVAPVVLAELHRVLPHYAVGFLPVGAGLMPMALLGVANDYNLYVGADGSWRVSYAPATLRGYPFALTGGQNGDKALAIDAEHLSQAGEPLFEDGELGDTVAQTLKFLQQYDHNRQATRAACQSLKEAGVLTPWPLSVPIGQERRQINGLYRVDEAALNALTAEAYATLQGAPMKLAYAQLYSISQVTQLAQLAELHEQSGAGGGSSPDLDTLFDEDDDELGFDFD